MARPEVPSDPSISMGQITAGPFSFTDEGSGPVVVAIPGYPGGPRDFRWLAPALGPDVRLVRLAMPGFEQTPLATEPGERLLDRARFITQAVTSLHLEEVFLLGHSLGGALAGMAAVELGARASGLGLICSIGPVPHPGVRGARMQRLSAIIRRPILGWPVRQLMPHAFSQMGFPPHFSIDQLAHTIHCAAALDFDSWTRHIDQLQCPTLVAWGEDDPLIPSEISTLLAERAPPGPRLPFARGGHSIQKHHAVEVAQALRTMMGLPPRADCHDEETINDRGE